MFVVTYLIHVQPEQRQAFSVCWRTIAEAKRDHCGSLGSQLFAKADGTHVVYERWPDKTTFDRCSLPDNYAGLDVELHALCDSWQRTGEMELAEEVTPD
jgi:heme-degrading monooxygenase HmoA